MARPKATVRGDKELLANLRRVREAIGGRNLDANLRTALEPMRQATEDNARMHRQPHSPPGGHLDEGVVIAKRENRGALRREYWISFKDRARKIAHLLEFGTAPHFQPIRGIMHPGARPFPFMRPAFESEKHEVADEIGRTAWAQIRASIVSVHGRK